MTLKIWFKRKTRIFLLLSGLIILVFVCCIGYISFSDSKKTLHDSMEQGAGLVGLGIHQKNRQLVETALKVVQMQVGAKSVVLCEGSRLITSINETSDACIRSPNLFTFQNKLEIEGFENYYLLTSISIISLSGPLMAALFLCLFATFFGAYFLSRMENDIENDLLNPLTEGLISGKNLDIFELEATRRFIAQAKENEIQIQVAHAILEISSQVAHDIRSPLSALNIVASKSQMPEPHKSIFSSAIERINQISQDLLTRSRNLNISGTCRDINGEHVNLDLVPVVTSIFKEKEIEFSSSKLRFQLVVEKKELFCSFNAKNIKRSISNLINNAVESISRIDGIILVRLTSEGTRARIVIEDNGVGISPEVLCKIGAKGFSFNKASGSGLGIFHTMKVMQENGGDVEIKSILGVGTNVILNLPLADLKIQKPIVS